LTAGRKIAALAWLLAAASSAVADDSYTGAAACRSCHAAEFERQSAGGHARTLYRAAEHPLAARFVPANPLRRASRFRFDFERFDRKFRVTVGDGEAAMEIPVEWAFGSGTHGVTFVSRLAQDSYTAPCLPGLSWKPRVRRSGSAAAVSLSEVVFSVIPPAL
jgi:hypothetical protein